MITVLIVGKGNVGTHLYNAFSAVDKISVQQISSRSLVNLYNADVTIIAVSDGAISNVSSKINNDFVVHTSGSFPLDKLKNPNEKGVFYMLQTFSKDKKVDFSKVPFCLEAKNEKCYKLLENLAKLIGNKIYNINSEQRVALHTAAVFVNNFANHLFKNGKDICNTYHIPFEILHPLIFETAEKIKYLSPVQAQTGPAIRNDEITIKNHLNLLDENQQKIYKLLTKSIQNGN